MKKRTITGIGIIAVTYFLLWSAHIPQVLTYTGAVLAMAAAYELVRAAGQLEDYGTIFTAILGSVGLMFLKLPGYRSVMSILFPLLIAVYILLMIRQDKCAADRRWKTLAAAATVTALLRTMPEFQTLRFGIYYLTMAVTLCFATDVMAYLIGSAVGRRKLIPKVSPNKTVEGSVGGILGAAATVFAMVQYLSRCSIFSVDHVRLALYTLLAAVIGEFGDLAMSCLKRISGVKDFGNLMPGHGGVLDRFDSHMFVIAFTLVFCHVTGGYLY